MERHASIVVCWNEYHDVREARVAACYDGLVAAARGGVVVDGVAAGWSGETCGPSERAADRPGAAAAHRPCLWVPGERPSGTRMAEGSDHHRHAVPGGASAPAGED